MMDSEEREIFYYLRGQGEQFISATAIGRHAGGRQKARERPDWAKAVLARMRERGILETDDTNSYRLKPLPETGGNKKWISPQIAGILRRSGKSFKGLVENSGDAEAYYDQL